MFKKLLSYAKKAFLSYVLYMVHAADFEFLGPKIENGVKYRNRNAMWNRWKERKKESEREYIPNFNCTCYSSFSFSLSPFTRTKIELIFCAVAKSVKQHRHLNNFIKLYFSYTYFRELWGVEKLFFFFSRLR